MILDPHQIVKLVPKDILNRRLIDENTEVCNRKGACSAQVCHKRIGKTEKLRDSIAHHAILYAIDGLSDARNYPHKTPTKKSSFFIFAHNARFLIEFSSLIIESVNGKRTLCTFVYSENFK